MGPEREYILNKALVDLSNAKTTEGIKGLTTPDELAALVDADMISTIHSKRTWRLIPLIPLVAE
jgi:hypothetical protein